MDAWALIDGNVPRTWEFFDQLGRWYGRALACDVDSALAEARDWLCHDAAFTLRPDYTTIIAVYCPSTDERARISTIITKDTQ
jgi:hypothetical protein